MHANQESRKEIAPVDTRIFATVCSTIFATELRWIAGPGFIAVGVWVLAAFE